MDSSTWAAIASALAFLLNVGVVVFYGGRLSQKVESIQDTLKKGGALDDRIARRILTHQIKCPAASRAQGTNPAIPVEPDSLGG